MESKLYELYDYLIQLTCEFPPGVQEAGERRTGGPDSLNENTRDETIVKRWLETVIQNFREKLLKMEKNQRYANGYL